MTYHQAVSKELALALNLQQVDKKGVSLALGSAYKVPSPEKALHPPPSPEKALHPLPPRCELEEEVA